MMAALLLFTAGCDEEAGGRATGDGQLTVIVKDANGMSVENFSVYKWTPGEEKRRALYSSHLTDEEGKARYHTLKESDYLFFVKGPARVTEENLSLSSANGGQFKKVRPTPSPQTITFNLDREWWEDQQERDARLEAERKAREEEIKNANVILTIRDENGDLLKNQIVYFGSKTMWQEAKDSGWEKQDTRSEYTDEDGVVRLELEPDEYVIGLDNVQSYHLMDYQNIPSDGNYVIERFDDRLEKEIQFKDSSSVDAAKEKAAQKEAEEERQAELEEERQKEAERREYCDPHKKEAVIRCCADDFYYVEGYYEGDEPKELFGHEFDIIKRAIDRDTSVWGVIIDGNHEGNTSQGLFTSHGLVINVIGCGHPRGGNPWCCMEMKPLGGENRRLFRIDEIQEIGQKEVTLKQPTTFEYKDSEYTGDNVIEIDDMILSLNRTVNEYTEEADEEIGAVYEVLMKDEEDLFMEAGDSTTLGNYTLSIEAVTPHTSADISVMFNGTSEEETVSGSASINGLFVQVKRVFEEKVWLSAR